MDQRSLLSRLRAAETGEAQPIRSLPELAACAPRAVEASNAEEFFAAAPRQLLRLHAALDGGDSRVALNALLNLSSALEFHSHGGERMGPTARRAQHCVLTSGGFTLLTRILCDDRWAAALDLRHEAAAVLRELCYAEPDLPSCLTTSRNAFTQRLLELCTDATLLEPAACLFEELSMHAKRTMQVSAQQVEALLRANPTSVQLAVLCRVFGPLLFEAAPPLPDSDTFGINPDAPHFCEPNHLTMLEAGGDLLPRLVALLKLARLPSSELSARMLAHPATRLLLERMPGVANALLPMLQTFMDTGRGPPGMGAHDAGPEAAEAAAAIADMEAEADEGSPPWAGLGDRPSHRVEVLSLLIAFMAGPGKVVTQDRLADSGFASVAEEIYDSIDWDEAPPQPHAPGLHGPGCTCNAATELRMQLLRALHAFLERESDNAANKRRLLSPAELRSFYTEPGAASPSPSPAPASPRLIAIRNLSSVLSSRPAPPTAPEPPGLLSKIVQRFIATPLDVPQRFSFASCAEAFLRGNNPGDQQFMAASGLLAHLAGTLRAAAEREGGPGFGDMDEMMEQDVLQLTCDLLGESVKFNRGLVRELDAALAPSPPLLALLLSRLVDSNVLIRALLLSMHAFATEDAREDAGGEAEAAHQPQRCEWMEGAPPVPPGELFAWLAGSYTELLHRLMGSVTEVEKLGTDNVCLVNSALLMLHFAERAGRLGELLAVLRGMPPVEDGAPPVCLSFYALLRAWKGHYQSKRLSCVRDRRSLLFSTRVSFDQLEQTVGALCGPAESECSLLHGAEQ